MGKGIGGSGAVVKVAIVLAIAVPSFFAGGLWFEPLLLHLPRYCIVNYRVVDGDTLECEGRKIRLVGFDAPETREPGARCRYEKQLGQKARCELNRLMATRGYSVVPLCRRDDWGRHLARLYIDGFEADRLLVTLGLALPYDGRESKPDWCALLEADSSPLREGCNPTFGSND